jgi:biopolymer transport protein ExbD
VNSDRTVSLNSKLIPLADLSGRLINLFRNHMNHVVFVRGRKDLEFRQVAEVIDIARGAGLDRIALMTQ